MKVNISITINLEAAIHLESKTNKSQYIEQLIIKDKENNKKTLKNKENHNENHKEK